MIAIAREQQTPQSLAQAPIPQVDQERKRAIRDAWKAYRGEFQRPLKVAANQADDNVISNRCAPIVDKGVSFLFGQVLKIEATDETAQPKTEEQDFINGLWGHDDDRMTRLSQMAINGGVCGQVFCKLIPAQDTMKYPRIVIMDPQLVRPVTHPEDCTLTLAYIIEYPTVNEFQKRQVIARIDPDGEAGTLGDYDIDDTWTITNYLRRGNAGSWYQVGEQEVWPYPFAPIFTCQNLPNPNEAWGMPDLTPDIIEQNKVLNFVQSNTSRIIKFHAHPKTYACGVSSSQISVSIDEVICLPSESSKLANLEMHSDLSSSLKFAETIRVDMDEQSRVPAIAQGRIESLPSGRFSGIALLLFYQPLIEKTIQKQRLYGRMIRDITRAALVLAGKIDTLVWEDYQVALHWQDLLPIDDLEAAQTGLLLQQLGVSLHTILAQLGYNADDEAKKTQVEAAKKMTVGQDQPVSLRPMPQVTEQAKGQEQEH